MPVSLSGLDMSWLKKKARPQRGRYKFDKEEGVIPSYQYYAKHSGKSKRSSVASPYFMSDIREFVSPVGDDNEVISSRPQLREHEKKHNCYQVGNDFGEPGTIGAKNESKKQKLQERVERADKVGVKLDWS